MLKEVIMMKPAIKLVMDTMHSVEAKPLLLISDKQRNTFFNPLPITRRAETANYEIIMVIFSNKK